MVGCWHGYLPVARCRDAYGPADATATHRLLLHQNPDCFTFLVPAHLGNPGQRAVKRVCVRVCVCVRACVHARARACVCKGRLGSQTLLKQDPAVLNWGRQLKLFFLFVASCGLRGFRFDASDIALLLAVAGTHSPDLLLSLTENQLPKCESAL